MEEPDPGLSVTPAPFLTQQSQVQGHSVSTAAGGPGDQNREELPSGGARVVPQFPGVGEEAV